MAAADGGAVDLEHRRLRALRLEAAAEQAEIEHSTGELEAAGRSMVDVCFELGTAGAEVVCEMVSGPVRGRISHVGAELIRIVSADAAEVDVAVAQIHGLRTVGEGQPGTVTSGHPSTVVARCRELANMSARVEVARPVGLPMRGLLTVAGDHHIEGEGATGPWFVPIDSICSVRQI